MNCKNNKDRQQMKKNQKIRIEQEKNYLDNRYIHHPKNLIE